MKQAPWNVVAFVTTLAVAVQIVTHLLAAQAQDWWLAGLIRLIGIVGPLIYAATVSYRKGFEAGSSSETVQKIFSREQSGP